MVKSRTENNTITSSLLTIYGFSSSDNGSYQCVASDSDNSVVADTLAVAGHGGCDRHASVRIGLPLTLRRKKYVTRNPGNLSH